MSEPEPRWWREAACLGSPPDIFFTGPGGSAPAARALCKVCPVRPECLADAVAHHDVYAIRAGLSPRQRGHPRGAHKFPDYRLTDSTATQSDG